ncbi:MAG TPA: hypothetical protein VKA49_20130 [Flavitalea sp.]|nr:hypothetical protein [Flavitalea sp.]
MNIKKENIPLTMQAPGTIMRGLAGYGGMTVAFNELPAGTDFTPMFQGLKNNSCHCPHWGYLLEGELLIKYDDGTEEIITTGDVFYLQPGHTAIVQTDTKFIDFSPEKELKEVLDHVSKKMAEFSK